MEIKLKTLKDIATAFVNGKHEIRGVREDELKAEAIKHRNNKFTNLMTAKEWIVWFFNLPEEDSQ